MNPDQKSNLEPLADVGRPLRLLSLLIWSLVILALWGLLVAGAWSFLSSHYQDSTRSPATELADTNRQP